MHVHVHEHVHVHAHVLVVFGVRRSVLCALIDSTARVVVCFACLGADVIKPYFGTLKQGQYSTRHVIHHFDRRSTHVHDYYSRAHLLLVIVEARIK